MVAGQRIGWMADVSCEQIRPGAWILTANLVALNLGWVGLGTTMAMISHL